jgi:hypothetical protein
MKMRVHVVWLTYNFLHNNLLLLASASRRSLTLYRTTRPHCVAYQATLSAAIAEDPLLTTPSRALMSDHGQGICKTLHSLAFQ